MSLKLTITSFQRLSPGQESSRTLDYGSLTIGRAAQNDWALQDPERILSSNHCVIHQREEGYFLTDTSTNGTFLNDSEQRIPRNQTVRLQDGDYFVLGEYEIQVSLASGAGPAALSGESGPLTDIIPGVRHVTGASDDSLISLQSRQKPPSRFTAEGAARTEPPPEQLLPERASFEPPELIPQKTAPEDELIPAVPTSAGSGDDVITAPSTAAVVEDGLIPTAPTAVAEEELIPAVPASAGSEEALLPAAPAAVAEEALMPPASVLAVLEPESIPTSPPAAPIPVDAGSSADPLRASVSSSPAGDADVLIPDDWWLAPAGSPASGPTAPGVAGPVAPPAPEPPPPIIPATPAVRPASEPPLSGSAAPLAATPGPGPRATAPDQPAAEDLLRAFLEGAGLPAAWAGQAEAPLEIMANVGAIFRETVQELMGILAARSDVKGEFRLDRTTIGPVENNPLKTPPGQPSLELEAVMRLLLQQQSAYMPLVQAVHEGFDDIKAHQLAVLAGIQAALSRLLERFDPSVLETRLEQSMFDFLPGSRKAKYWDLFTAEYQAIAHEAEEDFNELFGDEFARAYAERLEARP